MSLEVGHTLSNCRFWLLASLCSPLSQGCTPAAHLVALPPLVSSSRMALGSVQCLLLLVPNNRVYLCSAGPCDCCVSMQLYIQYLSCQSTGWLTELFVLVLRYAYGTDCAGAQVSVVLPVLVHKGCFPARCTVSPTPIQRHESSAC